MRDDRFIESRRNGGNGLRVGSSLPLLLTLFNNGPRILSFFMICTGCQKSKPRTAFYKRRDRKKGTTSECRECLLQRMAKWQKRFGRLAHTKLRKRLWRYSLSVAEFQKLLKQQKGLCALCLKRPAETIDHSHTNGKVRGLLCYRCNSGLGAFEDSVTLLEEAVKYLLSYE
jgi:hypothetical protein